MGFNCESNFLSEINVGIFIEQRMLKKKSEIAAELKYYSYLETEEPKLIVIEEFMHNSKPLKIRMFWNFYFKLFLFKL